MPLEFRKKPDGTLRPFWYGRYEVNGKRYCDNLGVRISGTPPASLSLMDEGDVSFERSRATAQAKLNGIVEQAREKRNAVHLVEKLYEIKTGEVLASIAINRLSDEWESLPRKRKPSERYVKQCRAALDTFAGFVISQNKDALEIGQVTKPMARAYMKAEGDRDVSPKTWNDTLKLLRTTFQKLLPEGAPNPFYGIPSRETDTIFREPFSPGELKRIIETSREHGFIRPIIITGICTAMRRGDCCLLQWKDVDLMKGMITVKTSKTGQTVRIPVFPMLYDELVDLPQTDKYVFPEQAAMFQTNPDGITWRVKKVIAEAFKEKSGAEAQLPELSKEATRERAHKYIEGMANAEKATKMRRTFDMYFEGVKGSEIMAELGISKGSISGYLNEIEAKAGCRIVRGRNGKGGISALVKADNGLLQRQRDEGEGLRRASIRDFHSFRVTWVTLALSAGVPLELVQKVTGHKTTEVVLKHYFHPGEDDFRQALQTAMPRMLTSGQHKTPLEQIQEIATKSTSKTAWRDIKAIRAVIAG